MILIIIGGVIIVLPFLVAIFTAVIISVRKFFEEGKIYLGVLLIVLFACVILGNILITIGNLIESGLLGF